MPDISSFVTPNNTEYTFKDSAAREAIAAMSGREWYIVTNDYDTPEGIVWIKDGVEIVGALLASVETKSKIYFVPQITEEGHDVYAEYVTVSPSEDVYEWEKFGTTDIDLSSLGALAYKDTATGTYTPNGSISVSVASTTSTAVNVNSAASGVTTYTPEGTVSAPTVSLKTAGNTGTIHNPTKTTVAKTVVAAAPGAAFSANAVTYYSVEGEKLKLYQLGYTTGDSITTEDVTVKTGDAEYEATAPSFSGTGVHLETENISVPTTFSGTFTGTESTITVS